MNTAPPDKQTDGQEKRRRVLVVGAMLLFVAVIGGGIAYFIKSMLGAQSGPVKQIVQEVQIIRPPPPPPDIKPPPEVQEEVDVSEPEPTPEVPQNEPAPGQQLGLDADGAAGTDGFGLLARKGGRDLLSTGGSAFTWYTGIVKNEILDRLQADKEARSGSYSVIVRLWLKADGSVERVKLMSSTGNSRLDGVIEAALKQLDKISQAPPADMPQPVSLRIVSRA